MFLGVGGLGAAWHDWTRFGHTLGYVHAGLW